MDAGGAVQALPPTPLAAKALAMPRDPYALVRNVAALRAEAKRHNPKRSNVPAHLAARNARTLAAIAKPKA